MIHESFTMTPLAADEHTDMPAQPALDPAISLAEFAASTATDPQPVGRCLTVARERGFTGEMVFDVGAGVRAYFDAGIAYFVERVGDAPISERLLELGVIDHDQLQRGVVRVGDIEHLGRLFDRDTTVDRDAVMVAVETMSDAVIEEVVAQRGAMYINEFRHHQSGLHRWFVAPPASGAAGRPVAEVAQVDRSVTEELPDLAGPAPTPADEPDRLPPLQIEWDDPDPITGAEDADADSPSAGGVLDIDIEAELGGFDADRADWGAGFAAPTGAAQPDLARPPAPATIPSELPSPDATRSQPADTAPAASLVDVVEPDTEAASDDLADFRIVWPDGTEEAAAPVPVTDAEPEAVEAALEIVETEDDRDDTADADATDREPAAMPAPDAETDETSATAAAAPAIRLDTLPEPDAEVPDDVADAVRRALAAIERAAGASTELTGSTSLPELEIQPVELPDLSLPTRDDAAVSDADTTSEIRPFEPTSIDELLGTSPVATPAADLDRPEQVDETPAPEESPAATALAAPAASAFAPPTPDMRAEAIYARAAEQATTPVVEDETDVADELPEPGRASVVFVEDEDEAAERTGALRRLISSLRRKP